MVKTIQEIVEIAYQRALPELIKKSKARLKHKKRVENRKRLKSKK